MSNNHYPCTTSGLLELASVTTGFWGMYVLAGTTHPDKIAPQQSNTSPALMWTALAIRLIAVPVYYFEHKRLQEQEKAGFDSLLNADELQLAAVAATKKHRGNKTNELIFFIAVSAVTTAIALLYTHDTNGKGSKTNYSIAMTSMPCLLFAVTERLLVSDDCSREQTATESEENENPQTATWKT